MLIDVSYFTAGPRQILNATLGKGTPKENIVIEQYIAEYQEEFLCRVLGSNVGNAVHEYLDDLENNPEADNNDDMDALCAKLRKPFADYVFYCILRDAGQTSTISGLVRLKAANEYVEPIVRQVTTWNRMANSLNVFAEWVDNGECPISGIVVDEYMLKSINRFNL